MASLSSCRTVHPFTGRRGAGLSGPGPSLPALLFHLPVLPAAQKRGAAQRRLLLHGLVRHHRDARLQVSWDTRGRGGGVLLMFAARRTHTYRDKHTDKGRTWGNH